MHDPASRVLTGFARVVTNDPGRGGMLGIVEGGAVAIEDGTVSWVGEEAEVPSELRSSLEVEHFDGATALPGFTDSHTHLVFGGHRAEEFGMRSSGATYQEILAAGGGIHSTVSTTRATDDSELVTATRRRLERMLAAGTTTVEVKSGYGLAVEEERRLLEAIHHAAIEVPIDVVPTFLGGHVPPPGMERGEYVDLVVGEMMEACAPLARFCDVFCDEGVFSTDDARRILEAGRQHGLVPKIHAEQLSHTGASLVAAEVGAVSADHLDHIDQDGIAALAEAGVVAVLLPGVSFSLRLAPPPARALWDGGVAVALATDCNPGTSYVETMQFVIAVAVREMGLTPDEAVWAGTRGGALAIGEPRKGRLSVGSPADVVVLDADSHLHLAYRPDGDLIAAVYKDGRRVG